MRAAEFAAIGAAVLAAVAPLSPVFVEQWFSTGLYPHVQRWLTPWTNAVPVAMLDIVLVLAIPAVIAVVVRGFLASWRNWRVAPFFWAVGHLVAAAAVVYLLFLGVWGLNYRRLGMPERLTVSTSAPTDADVRALGLRAAAEMNRLHAIAHRQGWTGEEWRDHALGDAFTRVQQTLSDAPPAVPGRLKRTLLGYYFRWTGVDGMINPLALEVLANPDLLPYERPFVAAHEWAHLAGYADESDASFVGWLTTIHADVPAQYSGWLYLYWQVSGEVSADERRRLADALEAGPRRDVDAVVARLRRGQWLLLRTAGWAVYDQYLKANRVDEGIRSYGAVVTLLLRARFQDGWVPVRRDTANPSR